MRIRHFIYYSLNVMLLVLACGLVHTTAAQTNGAQPLDVAQEKKPRTTVETPPEKEAPRLAGKTEMYCGGFIQYTPVQNALEIVGAEQEQEKHYFGQGDYVYLNAGSQQGMRVGQDFAIIRPRGQFTSKFTQKKGKLGVYTQELGQLRVVSVKDQVSVALITEACDTVVFGDMLSSVPQRVAPVVRSQTPLDHFSDPTGKQKGRIVMARDYREAVSKDYVVYIDLGAEDNIKQGDYFTIYRPTGTGNLTRQGDEELSANTRDGYESQRYRGGKFSNKSTRVRNPDGSDNGPVVKTPEIVRHRPALPRKVVGELVVLNVQQRTATAVITRVAQEIHTGDYVELQ